MDNVVPHNKIAVHIGRMFSVSAQKDNEFLGYFKDNF
jgi:hypothetical protein